jgi:hypothetical protein
MVASGWPSAPALRKKRKGSSSFLNIRAARSQLISKKPTPGSQP